MTDETKDPVAPSPANAAPSAETASAAPVDPKPPEAMPVIFNTAGVTPPVAPPPPGGPMAAVRSALALVVMFGLGYFILVWLGFLRPIGRGPGGPAGTAEIMAQIERESAEADQRASAAMLIPPPPMPTYAAPTITVSAGMIGDRHFRDPPPMPSASGSGKAGGKRSFDEGATIEAARTALAHGEAAKAMVILDGHDRDFPQGLMNPDATVLRIEALARTSDDAHAKELADKFLADFPHSPLAPRVRALLDAINRKVAGQP